MKNIIPALLLALAFQASAGQARRMEVPAGDLITAIAAIARQSGVELFYQPEKLKGLKTTGLSGEFTVQDALKQLLRGTELKLTTDAATGAMLIVGRNDKVKSTAEFRRSAVQVAQMSPMDSMQVETRTPDRSSDAQPGEADAARGTPEILVKGQRSINTDIRRTEDDPQPYVVFGSEEI